MKTILVALALLAPLVAQAEDEAYQHWNTAQMVEDIPTMKKECRAYADAESNRLILPTNNDSKTNLSIKLYMLCVEEWFIARPDTYTKHF